MSHGCQREQRPDSLASRAHRVVILIVFDALTWCLALMVFTVLRYDMAGSHRLGGGFRPTPALFVVIAQIVLGAVCRLHQGRTAAGSFEDFVLLSAVTLSAGALLAWSTRSGPEQWLPRTVPIAATFLALIAAGRRAGRLAPGARARDGARGPHRRPADADRGRRVTPAASCCTRCCRDRQGTYVPVGFLDDDPQMRNRRVRGVPVRGQHVRPAAGGRGNGRDAAVLAMPSAGRRRRAPDQPAGAGGRARGQGPAGNQ